MWLNLDKEAIAKNISKCTSMPVGTVVIAFIKVGSNDATAASGCGKKAFIVFAKSLCRYTRKLLAHYCDRVLEALIRNAAKVLVPLMIRSEEHKMSPF